jgi:hypothetical protein
VAVFVNEVYDPDDPWNEAYRDAGYEWCRSCKEWHRPPECSIDEQGRPLDPEGKPWIEIRNAVPTPSL